MVTQTSDVKISIGGQLKRNQQFYRLLAEQIKIHLLAIRLLA
jgi:hypothetical protein